MRDVHEHSGAQSETIPGVLIAAQRVLILCSAVDVLPRDRMDPFPGRSREIAQGYEVVQVDRCDVSGWVGDGRVRLDRHTGSISGDLMGPRVGPRAGLRSRRGRGRWLT